MVWNWLQCWMAVISALDSDPVADDGLDHKRVLKVTNPVALLCLTPVDTWKRKEFTRSVCEVELCSVHNTPTAIMPTSFHFQSAVVIPDKSRPYMYSGGKFVASFLAPIKDSDDKDITHVHHHLLRSVWMCPLLCEWLTQQEVPRLHPHTNADMIIRPPGC